MQQIADPDRALATAFVDAIVRLDFERVEALLSPAIRFRALIPSAVTEAATARGARAEIERWFADADRVELVRMGADEVVDRLHLAYRLRIHEDGAWRVAEQQAYAAVEGGHFATLSMLCSGFRPEAAAAVDMPGAASRLDAIGASCATLTPRIREAMADLGSGEVLEVVADDPAAEAGLAAWGRLTGNQLVATVAGDRGPARYFLRRA
jgi:tRNA 2-thiouridine synthesizing protein A